MRIDDVGVRPLLGRWLVGSKIGLGGLIAATGKARGTATVLLLVELLLATPS